MVRKVRIIVPLKLAAMKESKGVKTNVFSVLQQKGHLFYAYRRENIMKRTEAFILRKIYGKNILMPISKNEIGNVPIVLNEIAGEIWNLVEDNISRQQLLSAICNKYELDIGSEEETAVAEFINQLIELKLVIE